MFKKVVLQFKNSMRRGVTIAHAIKMHTCILCVPIPTKCPASLLQQTLQNLPVPLKHISSNLLLWFQMLRSLI